MLILAAPRGETHIAEDIFDVRRTCADKVILVRVVHDSLRTVVNTFSWWLLPFPGSENLRL